MAGDRKMWEQWKDWRLTEPINEGSKAVKALKEVNKSVISTIKGIKNFRKIIDDSPYVPVLTTISQELYRFEIDLEKKLRLLLPQMKKYSTGNKFMETVNEEHTIVFSKDEMAQLHNDGQIEKDGHKYVYTGD